MKKLAVTLLLIAAPALAEEEGEPSEELAQTPAQRTANFIIHHVSDSHEWEFELPFPGVEHHPTIHLDKVFAPLLFEATPGACHAPVSGAGAAFPSAARFFQGCYDFRPTKATLMMWFAAALLLLVAWLGVNRDKSKLVPKGVLANVVEVLVLFVRDEIVYKNIGKKEGERYVTYLTTVFFFILFMNWLGLIPNFGSATGQLSVTMLLAVCTFLLTQIAAIRSAGLGGYLAHLTAGTKLPLALIMIPVEILGLFTKPFALMMRLFANMLAGHMVLFFIIGLIFMLHWGMFAVSVPLDIAIYLLEIFVGILQAYIFTLLTALYLGQAVEMGHHGAHAEEGHGH
jgi:F-type H+-transporting ATPase subunit a